MWPKLGLQILHREIEIEIEREIEIEIEIERERERDMTQLFLKKE